MLCLVAKKVVNYLRNLILVVLVFLKILGIQLCILTQAFDQVRIIIVNLGGQRC